MQPWLERACAPGAAKLWLAGLALGAWALVPFGAFHYDDFPNIVLEPSTTDLSRATGLRPLLRLSYFLDHSIWGMNAHGFLLTNLVLHVGSVLCVYALAKTLTRAAGEADSKGALAAFLGAALFALQPAHAEVVAYATGRSTGLMTVLLLAGLVLRTRGRPRSALALFALACLAKETALIFPLLVWLCERDARALAKLALPALALLAALASVPRYRELAAWSLDAHEPLEALARNLSALPVQLSLWLRPWALSVEHASDLAPAATCVLAGAALAGSLLGCALLLQRRAPLASFACGWVLVALLPTSSLVARADLISERALYLAWVGPAIALGDALARWRAHAPRLALATAVLLLSLGGAASFARARTWTDDRLLWSDAVAKAPSSSRAWNNLGMAHLAHHEYDRADEALRRAIALDPSNARAQSNLRELGIVCGRRCQQE